ncbi:MAG: hypothetical protein AB2L07_14550 [Thermoanaerobaculaceae bacterium]
MALAVLAGLYLLAGPVEALWRWATGHPINLLIESEAAEVNLATPEATDDADHP